MKKKKTINITSSDGVPIYRGTTIIIRAGEEDVICKFVEINNGYFVTETLDRTLPTRQNKYRLGTIKKSTVVEDISFRKEQEDK